MVNAFAVIKRTPTSCTVVNVCHDDAEALQRRKELCEAFNVPSNTVSIEKIFDYRGGFFNSRDIHDHLPSSRIRISDFTTPPPSPS